MVDAFTTGAKPLGFSIGRGLGALKRLRSSQNRISRSMSSSLLGNVVLGLLLTENIATKVVSDKNRVVVLSKTPGTGLRLMEQTRLKSDQLIGCFQELEKVNALATGTPFWVQITWNKYRDGF